MIQKKGRYSGAGKNQKVKINQMLRKSKIPRNREDEKAIDQAWSEIAKRKCAIQESLEAKKYNNNEFLKQENGPG